MPMHINDCLAVSNSSSLYFWILAEMNKHFVIVDLGAASLYLGICIVCDHPNRKLWLSQKHFIIDLLTLYNLLNAYPSVPLKVKLHASLPCPPNSCPDIEDSKLTVHYQQLVGSILYLALCMRLDIAYSAMALGQFKANPTRAHMLAAKRVLCYLLWTIDSALEYNFEQLPIGAPLTAMIPSNCGMMDANWASDETNCQSVSGYVFFLSRLLVSCQTADYCSLLHGNQIYVYVTCYARGFMDAPFHLHD